MKFLKVTRKDSLISDGWKMEMETVGEGGMREDEIEREGGVGRCMRENGYKKALKLEQLS